MSGSCAVVHQELRNLPFCVVALLVALAVADALALVAKRISSHCGKDKGVAHLDENSHCKNLKNEIKAEYQKVNVSADHERCEVNE